MWVVYGLSYFEVLPCLSLGHHCQKTQGGAINKYSEHHVRIFFKESFLFSLVGRSGPGHAFQIQIIRCQSLTQRYHELRLNFPKFEKGFPEYSPQSTVKDNSGFDQ